MRFPRNSRSLFGSAVQQAQELRKHFKSLGAEISVEKSTKGIEDDLHKIVGVCDVCFKDGEPANIDGILNSIVSIMVSVSAAQQSGEQFCDI